MKEKTIPNKKNTIIVIPAGINAAKDSITAGGTPSGSLITRFFFIAHEKISTATIAVIIAKNIPAVPRNVNLNPLTLIASERPSASTIEY